MTQIKAFIFDMDGVLTETNVQHYEAWKILGDEIGIEINPSFNERLKGISRMASLNEILTFGGKQEDYTQAEKEQLATKKNDNYVKMIASMTPDHLFEGVKELFKQLKERNIKIAIGSASKNAPKLVKYLGIEEDIHYIVDANEIEKGKPAPDTFLAAAQAFGLKPEECIGVEDATAGVQAIKSAGMFAIGIGEPQVLSQADTVYKETKDINLEEILTRDNVLVV